MAQLLLPSNTVRSKFTVAAARGKVRSQLGLLDSNFIDDADVDDWLLEFQDLLARDTSWYKFNTHISTSGFVRYYDLPADCIDINYVQYDVWALTCVTLHDLIQQFPLALTNSYVGPLPWLYMVDGANRLTLFPMPSVSSGSVLLVIYSALPPDPVGDVDYYYWPPYSDTCAIYYAAMRGSMKDLSREGQRRVGIFSQAFEREYLKTCSKARQKAEQRTVIFGSRAKRPGSDPLRAYYPRTVPLPSP